MLDFGTFSILNRGQWTRSYLRRCSKSVMQLNFPAAILVIIGLALPYIPRSIYIYQCCTSMGFAKSPPVLDRYQVEHLPSVPCQQTWQNRSRIGQGCLIPWALRVLGIGRSVFHLIPSLEKGFGVLPSQIAKDGITRDAEHDVIGFDI